MAKLQSAAFALATALLAHRPVHAQPADPPAVSCYPKMPSGVTYQAGDLVSNTVTEAETYDIDCTSPGVGDCGSDSKQEVTRDVTRQYNFECKDDANAIYCQSDSPGTLHAERSWTNNGECDPDEPIQYMAIPTVYSGLTGCPEEYSAGTDYDKLDLVSVEQDAGLTNPANGAYSMTYQCKDSETHLFCGKSGFEPGTGQFWEQAWEALGSCTGTISPTQSPVNVNLANLGGCPSEWEPLTYEAGDVVSSEGLVFACKSWPEGAHCGQAGYAPIPSGELEHWEDAWDVVGYCSGTIQPTQSPVFDAPALQACPDLWESGGDYEAGDMVSAMVTDEESGYRAMFECSNDVHLSKHCSTFDPLYEHPGTDNANMGWTYVGGCFGTIGPTTSPTFDATVGPCAAEYDETFDEYEAGDQVSVVVSSDPVRTILFECKAWPSSSYCNQASFAPDANYGETSNYGHMAWEVKGPCAGTFAPTQSPAAYDPTNLCQFNRCRPGDGSTCVKGAEGCVCTLDSNDDEVCKLTGTVCPLANVEAWDDSEDYHAGDVVRVHMKRYECKPHPFTGWCINETYKPTGEDTGIWKDAWTKKSDCPAP